MKFAVAKEHRDFFQKQGWIEFEGVVTSDQLVAVNQAINLVLGERLNVTNEEGLRLLPSEQFYLHGHDLWRSNPLLRKFVSQIRFAEIAAELIEKKPLRLGYDQLFPARQKQQTLYSKSASQIYTLFLEQTAQLEAVSCLQGLACGLVVSLGGQDVPQEKTVAEGIDIFPKEPGNVIFFQTTVPIKWDRLYAHPGGRYYLIVYTYASAHYLLQPQDPHTHALKHLGYVFNDKLSDKLNPVIYR